jgi:hypothetical protein
MSIMAVSIGLYLSIYFMIDRNFGLLQSKSTELLANPFWNADLYAHLSGRTCSPNWLVAIQYNLKQKCKPARLVGKVYVISALLSSTAGFGIAFFATGGIVASLGFLCLAVIWFYTTLNANLKIRHNQQVPHQKMMIFSYAACFAAVTLRIWLPMLTSILGDFSIAYRIVAWMCWLPNIIVASLIVRRITVNPRDASTAAGNFV